MQTVCSNSSLSHHKIESNKLLNFMELLDLCSNELLLLDLGPHCALRLTSIDYMAKQIVIRLLYMNDIS